MESGRNWNSLYPVNIRKAKSIVDSEENFLVELFTLFLEHLPEQMEQLISAIEKQDDKTVQFIAHQLNGAMKNFAADEACKMALNLESAGMASDFDRSSECFDKLKDETETLKNYIENKGWRKYF